MARLTVYFAHPAQRTSRVNRPMATAARQLQGVTFIDLYEHYPRHDIDIAAEQARIVDSDVILFQFPLFWYSTPSIIKEWIDLVLEHGFAYGSGGDALRGKMMMLALTAAGPQEAYCEAGYQNFALRTFLTPLEQTARLCQMRFLPPHVLHSALSAPQTGEVARHVAGYVRLLEALRDDLYDLKTAEAMDTVFHDNLPVVGGA